MFITQIRRFSIRRIPRSNYRILSHYTMSCISDTMVKSITTGQIGISIITNSPDIFQEKMNELFNGFKYVRAYIDNLLITSNGNFEIKLK